MAGRARLLFAPDTDHVVVDDPSTFCPPEPTAESLPMGSRASHHNLNDPPLGGEPLDAMNFDVNSWESMMEDLFANVIWSESVIDAVIQILSGCQLEENRTNNSPTNPTNTPSAPDASSSSQPPSEKALPTHPDPVPKILPEHQSYSCSWAVDGSVAKCGYVAHGRLAFLRHLGNIHQASGASDDAIVCQLSNSKTGSACKKEIKRENFPRHVDTHYPIRFQCQCCFKSFSRQDSWKGHIRTTQHADTLAL